MKYRIEKDTMGEVQVPVDAMWGAQTQRALENFKISGIKFAFHLEGVLLKPWALLNFLLHQLIKN